MISLDLSNLFAGAVGKEHGLTEEEFSQALREFRAVPGRVEE